MQTIDLSWVTREDSEKAVEQLKTPTLEVNLESDDYFHVKADRSSTRSWLYLFCLVPQTNHFYLRLSPSKDNYYWYDGTTKDVPTSIKGILESEHFITNKFGYKEAAEFTVYIPEWQALHTQILNTFKAQSKEDFYDDASDYQDDEPTDFGDASNYDENLMWRIRKTLGS